MSEPFAIRPRLGDRCGLALRGEWTPRPLRVSLRSARGSLRALLPPRLPLTSS